MSGVVHVDQAQLRAQLEKKLPPKVRLFQLEDIPGVMRSRLGWPVAAALMERWFRGAAFEMPDEMKLSLEKNRLSQLPAARLDENTVTMAWALRFPRVHAAVEQLQANWASTAGRVQLQKRVLSWRGMRGQGNWRFGDLNLSAKHLDDTCQVNFLNFGRFGDPLDDFYGAMGEATLKVAASGMVTPKPNGKATVAIDELGFYLRDAYDFNDDSFISQPLGFWGFEGVERSLQLGRDILIDERWAYEEAVSARASYYLVQNAHFRKWRARHGLGGDFMVLSDVYRVRLPFPIQLEW
ncbi:DUF6402 family protein [Paracidovorax cattleyae]|uniref:Uncharacterized protein n=1 Tax=Paracidovorax cattleyae TaxID=80868 RepID=A0A1H0WIN5_9BURK|nr:DUF6402 family protein [Paracidovorax cattleyae]AVS76123.1 hypothetical protein C8240_20925 [Paracidovorax cattleyae]SDP90345.1 hypothetical protein SAMN04489708_14014 [Paracidovorax cattleyae]